MNRFSPEFTALLTKRTQHLKENYEEIETGLVAYHPPTPPFHNGHLAILRYSHGLRLEMFGKRVNILNGVDAVRKTLNPDDVVGEGLLTHAQHHSRLPHAGPGLE